MNENLPANVRPLRPGVLAEKPVPTPSVADMMSTATRQDIYNLNMAARNAAPREKVDYDGSLLPTPNYHVSEMPQAKSWICGNCKLSTNGVDNFGSIKDPNGHITPCPICYPPIKKLRVRRRVDTLLKAAVASYKLSNMANLPTNSSSLSLALYPAAADQGAKARVQRFVQGQMKELFLHGEPGRGKTGLAISAAYELISMGAQVLFLPMVRYIELLRDDNDYSNTHKVEIRDITQMVEILIVDDMGVETPSKATIRDTQELIEARHTESLRTLITSNMSPEGLEMFWELPEFARTGFQPGSRIISRMGRENGQGWYTKYKMAGPDLRSL